jgi:transcription elongation factor GreA
MEKVLSNARIIDESQLDMSKVLVLSTVEVKILSTGQLMKYTLVAQTEADLKRGKISVESPIGRGLLGKGVGEIAEISIPNGKIELEIININRG